MNYFFEKFKKEDYLLFISCLERLLFKLCALFIFYDPMDFESPHQIFKWGLCVFLCWCLWRDPAAQTCKQCLAMFLMENQNAAYRNACNCLKISHYFNLFELKTGLFLVIKPFFYRWWAFIVLSIPNNVKHHLHVCCSPAEGNIQSSFTIRGKQHIAHSADAQSKSRNHREGEQVQCEDAEIWWWQKCREQESIGVIIMKLKFRKGLKDFPMKAYCEMPPGISSFNV